LTTIPGWVIVCDGEPFSLPSNRVKNPENFYQRMLENPIAMTKRVFAHPFMTRTPFALKRKKPPETKRELEYELVYRGKSPVEKVLSQTPEARLKEVRAYLNAQPNRRAERSKGLAGDRAWANMLISGDNLGVLKTLLNMKENGAFEDPSNTARGAGGVRLVYIDPPFSTRLTFKTKTKKTAYTDTLVGAEFLEFLRKRLIFLRELLAHDGSIYVHLDWKKAHYVKAVMDEVFGEENFLNDIIWHYGGRGAKAVSRQFSRNHDIILLYRKKDHLFNRTFVDKRVQKKGHGFRQDELGRWFKTAPRGDYTDRSIRELEEAGRIYRTRNGNVRIKYFVREVRGELIEQKLVGDVWNDIPDAMHLPESERTGYPTQKPEKLLSRIISASTMKGDIVLDAFSGAGTTLVAAEKLGRRWIGIDSGKLAIETSIERIRNIAASKDLENPGKRHPKLTPFVLYRATGASRIKKG
jgi:DNA modification methylase